MKVCHLLYNDPYQKIGGEYSALGDFPNFNSD